MTDAGRPPDCVIPDHLLQADGCLPFHTMGPVLDDPDCTWVLPDGGLCFSIAQTVVDKHGHQLDGDFDPKGRHGCDHRDTPEWQAEHAHRQHATENPMSADTSETPEAPVLLAASGLPAMPDASAATLHESVGVDQAVSQVKSLIPGGADASPALLIGGAATLAVVGGAIKFGPQMLKARAEKAAQEHEARMKQLEIEQQKADQQKQQDDNHQQCSAARVALEARVAAAEQRAFAAESKLASVESKIDEVAAKAEKSGGLALEGFDPEALEERIKQIEKTLKPKPAAGGKKR